MAVWLAVFAMTDGCLDGRMDGWFQFLAFIHDAMAALGKPLRVPPRFIVEVSLVLSSKSANVFLSPDCFQPSRNECRPVFLSPLLVSSGKQRCDAFGCPCSESSSILEAPLPWQVVDQICPQSIRCLCL